MLRLLVLPLCLLDLALAALAFALLARPDALLGLVADWAGEGEAWEQGRLDAAARERLLGMTRRARVPVLFGLFGWSFLCGALLMWARI